MSIERKVAIITGASQGIGAELVRAYRNRNYRVVANSRSIEPSRDSDVLAVGGDIADPATAERIICEALALFGRIDTLINNAGVFLSKPFVELTQADFDHNLGGQRRRLFPRHTARRRRDAEAGLGPHCLDHGRSGRPADCRRAGRTRRADQGCAQRGDALACHRVRQPRPARQRGRPRHHQDADAP
jgi:hypothetical protein